MRFIYEMNKISFDVMDACFAFCVRQVLPEQGEHVVCSLKLLLFRIAPGFSVHGKQGNDSLVLDLHVAGRQ